MKRRFFWKGPEGSRPVVGSVNSHGIARFNVGDDTFSFSLKFLRPGLAQVTTQEGQSLVVAYSRLQRGSFHLFLAGEEHVVELAESLPGSLAAGSAGGGREEVRAPIPGKVVQVLAEEGTVVTPGEAVLVLEAMKMENLITSQFGGKVRAVHVKAGATVERGQILMVLAEP